MPKRVYPGGAQKAREKRARLEAEAQARAAAAGELTGPELYRTLGEPPDDPTCGLVWAQRATLLALHEVVTDPALEPRERWKLIRELSFVVGTTHAKTLIQHKLDRVTRNIESKQVTGGPRKIEGLVKPPTARGYKAP